MDFKTATDHLFNRVTHEELAHELGASVPAIRQARLDDSAHGFRSPPGEWEEAVRKLAEKQIKHYQKLAGALVGKSAARKARS